MRNNDRSVTATENDPRRAIVDACREMNKSGINQGTSGNISVRSNDGLLITPSGMDYDRMRPEHIVAMQMDGTWQGNGACRPSSEWRIHRDILRAKPEVGAVVHAHPTYCTILAIMGRAIPAVHYMVAAAGGNDIRCAGYATFGSQALSDLALQALAGRHGCLLAHHGMVATGPSLARAMWLAVEMEALARQYHGCLQIGEPPLLHAAEMQKVVGLFADYGKR
jgi:L-fuculose-phosphate aldolase